jgi:serine-type D-Ala-D-Ala carboxypeptidase (penicillin-binding protein 5/6)
LISLLDFIVWRQVVARWCFAAVLVLQALAPAMAAPPDPTQGFVTKAPRAVLMEAATGAVLFQRNGDELAPPASLSKLMTLAVLFKAMKSGKVMSLLRLAGGASSSPLR